MKYLIGQASFSRSPVAKPWYAESKNGIKLFFFMTAAICFHSYSVGSTPVGLWAQACSKTTEPAIPFYKNLSMAGMFEPNVLALKYGYSIHFNEQSSIIFLWLSQVGSGIYTNRGKNNFINSNPMESAPVPDKVWVVATLPYLTACESPNNNLLAPVQNPAKPSIGRYSLLWFPFLMISSAYLTALNTYGLPSPSL